MNLDNQEVMTSGYAAYMPALLKTQPESCRDIYEHNRHRVYSLAFWMTDNELAAEELMYQAFRRAFACIDEPSASDIDQALMIELRDCMPIGELTLNCAPCDRVLSVRKNTLRVDLERAVVQLPNTEKLVFLMHDVERYDHARIARLLHISQPESRLALHQARLRMRELLAN